MTAINNKYDFSLFFDITNGNPNGDPDQDNMPRTDQETGNGLMTDVSLKRKVRDYVSLTHGNVAPWRIYIQRDKTLNALDAEAFAHAGVQLDCTPNEDIKDKIKNAGKDPRKLEPILRQYMCETFFDIRTFGAVMTSLTRGRMNGQLRGPVQLGFARSIDPVSIQQVTITREAITTESDSEKKTNEMGHKYIIPYGLYRVDGYVSASLAQKVTGFSEDDLQVLWQALANMFEFDHSAARASMSSRLLYIFKHSSTFGDAPSYQLFDAVTAKRKEGVETARKFSDYDINVDLDAIPDSVGVTEYISHRTLQPGTAA